MQVQPSSAPPFPALSETLPLQTIHVPLKQPLPTDIVDSPTPDIPDLPKNAYGLESFADYCTAVHRVKAGLPPTEAETPPDRSKPLIIQGVTFKYWNPDHSESEISDTDSENTALQPAQVVNDSVKSNWSAGSPRKSILRQSTSSPLVRESEQPLLEEGQNQLVYEYASSASASSRRTSRLSSRRVSIDAGVQSEPMEVRNNEEVVRVAAAKRLSARRSSIAPVRRSNCVHGLAGFTGIGRADSGAVVCVANGKRFELVVETYDRDDGNDIALQCSGLDIDSEMEALFGQKREEEVIDVDAVDENEHGDENVKAVDRTGEAVTETNFDEEGDRTMNKDVQAFEEPDEVPSPEQLRSNRVSFMIGKPGKMTPVMTPIAQSPRSDEQDMTFNGTFHDEIVTVSAHAAKKRHIPLLNSAPRARVSAPPRITASRLPEGTPESELDKQPEVPSAETEPPSINFVEQEREEPVHAIMEPINTSAEPNTLDVVRQRSLSLKPQTDVPLPTASNPMQAIQGQTLHIGAVRGVDIHPTASAYQLAAMATLSPRSYLRAIQPSQSRIVFRFASPGGTGPVRGVNIAPPNLMSTPPIATLGVAPDSLVPVSLAAAPRKSHVSMPRIELSTPRHENRVCSRAQHETGSTAITPHVNFETEELMMPASQQNAIENSESVRTPSQRTKSTVQAAVKQQSPSQTDPQENKASLSVVRSQGVEEIERDATGEGENDLDVHANMAPLSAVRSQDAEENQGDFADEEDDDFERLPDFDDGVMDIEPDIEPMPEAETEPDAKPESTKSKSRKASMASSKTRSPKKTQQSSASEQIRASSVTQDVKATSGGSSDEDRTAGEMEVNEIVDLGEEHKEEARPKKKSSRKTKAQRKQTKKGGEKTSTCTGQKRWRELRSLPTNQVNLNDGDEEVGLRRSKRQRFPRLKFWKNETVSYERRLSQAIPTIAEVIVEVGGNSESDDDTWFGRR